MASVLTSIKDKQIPAFLHRGLIGVLPTDTLYGVACIATNKTSVKRLYALKHRERKPGTIIASNIEQLVSLGIKKRYLTAISKFWPGPISIVVPTDNPTLTYLDMGKGTLALRVIADKALVDLLENTGPLLTSSANMPGKEPANNVSEAQKYFGEHVDFYVDGGDYSGRRASTIIRIIDDSIELLRDGAVKIDSERGRVLNDT